MLKFIFFLYNIGITEKTSNREKRLLRFKNITLLVMSVPSIPYSVIFYITGHKFLALSVFTFICLYFTSLYANYKRYYNYASITVVLWGSLAILFFSFILGKSAGIQNILLAMTAIGLVIFRPQQKYLFYTTISIPVLFFIILESCSYSIGYNIELHETMISAVYILSISTAFFVITSSLLFYISENSRYEKELEISLKEASERKIQLEKVSQQAAFTRLTMGISHEIRNPMASMLTRSEIVEQAPENVAGVLKFTGIIKQNIKRILNITETMLKYGNPTSHKKENVSIVALIKEILDLTENKMKNNKIKVNTYFSDSQLIYADPVRLHQAFLNILLNAIESMSQNGGALTVTTECIEQRIILTIKDEGVGMTAEEKNQIFDPFYTTKYENTGLGMSITLRCIDENNGLINCNSQKGKGTTFTISFPVLT